VSTQKVNESKVQGKLAKQKLTFDQLLNKYTKAVLKDRPLKRDQGQRTKASIHLLGEDPANIGVMWLLYSLLKRYILQCHGSMKGFGCNVIRCRIHHIIIREEKAQEDLC
jgi:hypothetical protein